MRVNNGDRVISKHKGAEFAETKTHRDVDPDKLKVLTEANEIAEEWVTAMRLEHVLDKLPNVVDMSSMPVVIKAMVEDVYREGKGEFVESKSVEIAIGRKTAIMFKKRLEDRLKGL
jgi:hypothetical protein